MKVIFSGFWEGFFEKTDANKIDFFIELLYNIYNEEIIVTNNLDEADILFNSVFAGEQSDYYLNYKKWKASFLFTGESYYAPCMLNNLSLYTCILGFNPTVDNFVEFPFYIVYLKSYPNMTFTPTKTISNNYTSAVISNGSSNERLSFLDKLEDKMTVLYGGFYKNNIGGRVEGNFASETLLNFYKNSKFVITMENTRIGHYITEKLINGFRAGIIPIYWGSQHISEHFNSKRFIILEDMSESSINKVIDKMANMSNEEYFQIINEPIFNTDKNIDIIYNNAINNIKKLVL
jgi:hypothetical protein